MLLMHKWLCATLAVLMLAANFPEAFCFCNSGDEATRGVSAVLLPSRPPGERPGPGLEALLLPGVQGDPGGAASRRHQRPVLTFGGYFQPPAAVAASLPWAICRLPEIARVAGPPGSSEGAGRALPIFLGHLLI